MSSRQAVTLQDFTAPLHVPFCDQDMIATVLIQEVDRLLKEGQLSHRQIAAQVGVSRGTVNAVASGRRILQGRDSQSEGARSPDLASPPVRCPRCGYRIYAPCRICHTRDHKSRQQGRRP